ncbi:MAG: hypothetical protein IPL12_00265 [Bacteroidetes bacterium]|nr:hypothetical protein [Bacteroidota bacterium]
MGNILATGNSETSIETPLAWDSPIDAKTYLIFMLDNDKGAFGKTWINKMTFYTEAIYRTGKRYTPYELTGYEAISGRPIYEIVSDPVKRYSEIGASNFWLNITYKKWWDLKTTQLAFTFELTNVLNTLNTAIVNPVTGEAYTYGDPVPSEWRDPAFIDPRDPRSYGTPPDNPARYYEQRHLLLGLSWKF